MVFRSRKSFVVRTNGVRTSRDFGRGITLVTLGTYKIFVVMEKSYKWRLCTSGFRLYFQNR